MYKRHIRRWAGLLLLALSFPTAGYGWGHLDSLNQPLAGNSYLVRRTLNERKILFCVDLSQGPRYHLDSIATQTEMAIKAWIDPLKELGIHKVLIQNVECDHPNLSLKIAFCPHPRTSRAHTTLESTWDGANTTLRTYPLIVINLSTDRPVDFRDLLEPEDHDFRNSLRRLARARVDLGEFYHSYRERCPAVPLEWRGLWGGCTYSKLLHELGHAFGLCDTYLPARTLRCDRVFQSEHHPDSIMKTSAFFYLTPDDVEGIQSLFRRFSGS